MHSESNRIGCGKSSPAETAAAVLVPNTVGTVLIADAKSDTEEKLRICDSLIKKKVRILKVIDMMKKNATAALAEDKEEEAKHFMECSAELEAKVEVLERQIDILQNESIYLGQNNNVDFSAQRGPVLNTTQMQLSNLDRPI